MLKKQPKTLKSTPFKNFRPAAEDLRDAPQRAKKILAILRKTHPDARIALDFRKPLELLVSTILSAQCTDVRVNIVTRDLFRKYRAAADYVNVPPQELEQDIKSAGFYRNKAKNIQAACRDILIRFGGKVPDVMDDLLTLPGVGRKTANVILANAYGIPGIVTDTHVIRLSRLMGLADQKDPVKLEFALMELIPKKDWTLFGDLLIFHGRRICIARKPDCDHCPVRLYCCYGRSILN